MAATTSDHSIIANDFFVIVPVYRRSDVSLTLSHSLA